MEMLLKNQFNGKKTSRKSISPKSSLCFTHLANLILLSLFVSNLQTHPKASFDSQLETFLFIILHKSMQFNKTRKH